MNLDNLISALIIYNPVLNKNTLFLLGYDEMVSATKDGYIWIAKISNCFKVEILWKKDELQHQSRSTLIVASKGRMRIASVIDALDGEKS